MNANDPGTVLLDLDGTLSDNYEGIAASIRYALERLGVSDPGDDALRACVGPPLRETFPGLIGTHDVREVERAVALYRERFSDVGWMENRVYDGIPEALAAVAAAGHPMLVCTSKPQRFAERIVARFGFARWVTAVYGADLAGKYDDKAALMAHLIAREALVADACVMVGDRRHDVRAARINGVRSIGVLWGYGTRDELADAGARCLVAHTGALAGAVAAAWTT